MRRLKIGAGIVVALGMVMAGGYYYFTKPYYEPGMVRQATALRDPLTPPAQDESDAAAWLVTRDIRLHHFSVGKGPDILFVHGGPGMPPNAPMPGVRDLADRYKIHFYDQRGSGRSTRPVDRTQGSTGERLQQVVRPLGIQEQIADMERIRRILGREKLILIGHSFGGFLSALYAAEFPEHVQAIVLVAPANLFRFPPEPENDLFTVIAGRLKSSDLEEFKRFRAELMDYSATLEKSDDELARLNWRTGDFFMRAAGPGAVPTAMAGLVDPGSTAGWGVQALYISLGMRFDMRSSLKQIRCPVLVIHGRRDLIPEASTREIAGLIEGARFQVVDTGHFPFAENSREFSGIVRGFLKDAGL